MNTPEAFGDYILIDRVAIGGMAEIFRGRKANDPSRRDLCIKRILPHYSEDESFINMFIDEASIAAKLQHPNIVQIYDFDTHEGCYYIAMELINGRDLKQSLELCAQRNTQLSVEMIMIIVAALGRSLHYAHVKEVDGQPLNIVHRDVSPHNVLLGFNGDVKLTDFGIAKAASRITTTRAGTVKGKCAYMSPEQARGKTLDGRSDIFSIGILMYEMLTGRRLFTGDSDFDILTKVLKEKIAPPSTYREGLDPEVERICMMALERDRDRRYSSGAALEVDVQTWLDRKLGGDLNRAGLGDFMQILFGVREGELPAPGAVPVPEDIAAVADMKTAMFDRANFPDAEHAPDSHGVEPTAEDEINPRMIVPAPNGSDMVFHDEKTAISESPLLAGPPEPEPARTEAIDYADVMAAMEQKHNASGPSSVEEDAPPANRTLALPFEDIPQPAQQAPPSRPMRQAPPAAMQQAPQKKTPWGLVALLIGAFGFFLLAVIGAAGYYAYNKTDLFQDTPDAVTDIKDPADPKDPKVDPDKDPDKDPAMVAGTDADAGTGDKTEKADAGSLAGTDEADAGTADKVDASEEENEKIASLNLISDPPGAAIEINGEDKKATTPATIGELPRGKELTIVLKLDGYEDKEETLTLNASEVRKSVSLDKVEEVAKVEKTTPTLSPEEIKKRREDARKRREEAQKAKGKGTIVINAYPWADVRLDGRKVGRTPVRRQVTSGRHTVVLSNPDLKKSKRKAVSVAKDKTANVFHRFK